MMSLINATLIVATLYKCDRLDEYYWEVINKYDPIWRQTVIGCQIVNILQDMYKFNVSYVYDDLGRNLSETNAFSQNNSIDVYVRSMSLSQGLLDYVYPVICTNTWRFGFLLSRSSETQFFSTFYSKPFSRTVWNCLYAMAVFVSIIFYLLKRWECRVRGGSECSFHYETLMVIGAYCQHIPPIDPQLASRRIAYLIFFVFAYIVYTYYTSNLLSNLVNEKDHGIDLQSLAKSDYECVIVDYMMLAVYSNVQHYHRNVTMILNKLLELRSVSVPEGLEAVRNGHVALLSDYTTIYPYIKKYFDNDDICKLISVDLFSKIMKYFFTSNDFEYKELFKIGTLRIKEAGILKHLLLSNHDTLSCTPSHHVQATLMQISVPITILIAAYVASALILVAERIHYKNNKVWPYVE